MNKYELIYNIMTTHFRQDGGELSQKILDLMETLNVMNCKSLARHLAKINGFEIRFDSPAAKEEWENGVRKI